MVRALFISLLLWSAAGALQAHAQQGTIYEVHSGRIEFHSEAPKELISAASSKLRGVVDIARRTFAFRIDMSSFQGFNSPLQREHFNENYMETPHFPEAMFSGKIIEEIDLTANGSWEVRAKGKLTVHGMALERIIKATVVVKNKRIVLHADFTVLLADHNIKIPRVVYDKLSPEINVSVDANLMPRAK